MSLASRCEICQSLLPHVCLEVRYGQAFHRFCCFQCAIHSLAPACMSCGAKIIGHPFEADEELYCCTDCAVKPEGFEGVRV